LAWLLLPDTTGSLHLERALRQGHTGSIVLLVVTALSILPDPHPLSGFWTVVLIAGLVVAYLAFTRQSPSSGPGADSRPAAPTATPQDAPRW
ncbi:MAG TPA: hypothetical protein PLL54_06010, partial [Dermatophilaceae bacterium]|nr:hypothetical protein [Dermatophilaceae bacterium]